MKRQFVFGSVMAAALTAGIGAQSTTPQTPTGQGSSAQGAATGNSMQDRAGNRGQAMTVTGCLSNGTATATGTAGAATTGGAAGATNPSRTGSTASGGSEFVLTDVSWSDSASAGASGSRTGVGTGGTGATGAATSGGSAASPAILQLMASGSGSPNWSRYLNHRVEVKGTFENAAGGNSGMASGTSSRPGSTGTATAAGGSGTATGTGAGTGAGTGTGAGVGTGTGAGVGAQSATGARTGTGTPSENAMFHVTSIKEVSGTCSGSAK
jgi:hypothetical protein